MTKKKTKKRNTQDLTKRNNDARKKEIKYLKDQIRLLWKTIDGIKLDLDTVWEHIFPETKLYFNRKKKL